MEVAIGANCTLGMSDSSGNGWNGAECSAPGFGQNFSLASGFTGYAAFVIQQQHQPPGSPPSLPPPSSPPSPPDSPPWLPPPSSPPSPGSPPQLPPQPPVAPPPPAPPYMPDAHVNSTSGLTEALANDAIRRVVLMPGTYELDANTNGTCSGNESPAAGSESWFCIDRAVTIEAAEAGTVELNAKEQKRLFFITGTGVALIGLDITGGIAIQTNNWEPPIGGGVWIEGGEATLVNCNIFGNRAFGNTSSGVRGTGVGGGLFVGGPVLARGRVALIGCNVHGNNASDGGGLFIAGGSTANISECSIVGNIASFSGIGLGGGLRVDGSCTMTSSTIVGNSALYLGGGLALTEGGSATLDRCTIDVNSARDGGGVSAVSGILRMGDCALRSNRAGSLNRAEADQPDVGGWGGTCMCGDGETYAVGDNNDGCASLACVGGTSGICQKFSNGQNPGAGVRVTCGRGRGGGLFASSGSQVSCTSCTLSKNTATDGGGMLIAGTATAAFERSYFEFNQVLGGDGGAINVVQEGELMLSFSEFEGNVATSDSASAIYYESTSASSMVVGCTFRNHSDTAALVVSEKPLSWECQLGQWSPHIGRIDADDFSGCASKCPVGTLGLSTELTSSAGCSSCPAGLSTNAEGAHSVTECACPVGFYTHTPSNCTAADVVSGPELPSCMNRWTCEKCPEHTICNTPNVTLVRLDVEEGYWRQTDFSSEIRPCDNTAACLGGTNVSTQCATGHHGPYCDVCMPHYFGGRDGQLCTPCEKAESIVYYIPHLAVLLLLFGVLVFFVSRCACAKRGALALGDAVNAGAKQSEAVRNHGVQIVVSFVAALAPKRCPPGKTKQIRTKLRILVASWQVLGELGVIFEITYPQWYEDAINGLSALVQLDLPRLLPAQCLWSVTFDRQLLLRTLVPLALMGLTVGIGSIARVRPSWRAWSDRCPELCFNALFIVYPSCCSAIFSFFPCDSLSDGSRYLVADYSIDCDSSSYRGMRAYALVMFLFYPFGTPLLFYFLLRKQQALIDRISRHEYTAHALRQLESKRWVEKMSRRRRLDSFAARNTVSVAFITSPELLDSEVRKEDTSDWHEAESERLRKKLPTFVALLTESYEMRCAKFEVFECIRKVLIVGIPALFTPSNEQFMYGLLISFMNFGVYLYWTPYIDHDDDQLEAAAQLQIFCALLMKLAVDPSGNNTMMMLALFCLLLGPPLLAGLQVSGLHTKLKKLLAYLTDKVPALCSAPLVRPRRFKARNEAPPIGGEVRRQRPPSRLTSIRLRRQPSSVEQIGASSGQELGAIREGSREFGRSSRKISSSSSLRSEGSALSVFQVAPDI